MKVPRRPRTVARSRSASDDSASLLDSTGRSARSTSRSWRVTRRSRRAAPTRSPSRRSRWTLPPSRSRSSAAASSRTGERWTALGRSFPGAWRETADGGTVHDDLTALVEALAARAGGGLAAAHAEPVSGGVTLVLEVRCAGAGALVAFGVDVSATARLEAELARARDVEQRVEALALLGERAAELTRDLNDALAIELRAVALDRTPVLSPGARARVTALRGTVQDAIERVQSVNRVVRATGHVPEAGAAEARSTCVRTQLAGALEVARPHVQSAAARRGVALTFAEDVPEGLPRVAATQPELHHALVNLLLSAADAMADGGLIEVRARAAGAWVVVSIADERQPSSPEHLQRLLDPLSAMSDVNGIGLASVARVIRTCGGIIAAGSRPGGGGAVITLTLPVAAPGAPATGP
jgi:signal transduction histidine kinase